MSQVRNLGINIINTFGLEFFYFLTALAALECCFLPDVVLGNGSHIVLVLMECGSWRKATTETRKANKSEETQIKSGLKNRQEMSNIHT